MAVLAFDWPCMWSLYNSALGRLYCGTCRPDQPCVAAIQLGLLSLLEAMLQCLAVAGHVVLRMSAFGSH